MRSSRKATDKDDVAADLAVIAAAQKVEHYEISGVRHVARARRTDRTA